MRGRRRTEPLTERHPTNLRIAELRDLKGLTRKEIARICRCSKSWVDSWLADLASGNYRECPAPMVRLLEMELGLVQAEHTDKIRELEAQVIAK